MYGVRPPLLLADTPTMLASLMIIVNSLGFTSLRNALMFFQVFQNFKALVERQFDSQILAIQSDWGGEYEKLDSFFQTLGISHHVSCPHAHQQNGSAERKHRHIVEVGLALLAGASMPLKFWDEAFLTDVHLINMLPSRVINNETPMQRFFHTRPDYNSLRVFGCACWPNLHPYNTRKLMFRSKQCVFLGYSAQHKGVKCLDVSTGRVYISRDFVFDETVFPFAHLHPNAGALLRKEILLLPSHLSGIHHEDDNLDDHLTNPSDHAYESRVTGHDGDAAEKNLPANGQEIPPNGPYFMCSPSGSIPALESSLGSGLPDLTRSSSGSPPYQEGRGSNSVPDAPHQPASATRLRSDPATHARAVSGEGVLD